MTEQRGFTIMETVVTAAIVAVVLSATIGVLARYTDTDVTTQKLIRAQELAQAEVDEVLARHAVENSLASDNKGRARTYVMTDPWMGYLISQYYFHNFPMEVDHGAMGTLNLTHPLFRIDQLRTGQGAEPAPGPGNPGAVFTLRYQLLGIDPRLPSESLSKLITLTAQPTKNFYDFLYWDVLTGAPRNTKAAQEVDWAYAPLIADSSPSHTPAGWVDNMRPTTFAGYHRYASKVLIVRVYDRTNPRQVIAQAYGVLTGRVQL